MERRTDSCPLPYVSAVVILALVALITLAWMNCSQTRQMMHSGVYCSNLSPEMWSMRIALVFLSPDLGELVCVAVYLVSKCRERLGDLYQKKVTHHISCNIVANTSLKGLRCGESKISSAFNQISRRPEFGLALSFTHTPAIPGLLRFRFHTTLTMSRSLPQKNILSRSKNALITISGPHRCRSHARIASTRRWIAAASLRSGALLKLFCPTISLSARLRPTYSPLW